MTGSQYFFDSCITTHTISSFGCPGFVIKSIFGTHRFSIITIRNRATSAIITSRTNSTPFIFSCSIYIYQIFSSRTGCICHHHRIISKTCSVIFVFCTYAYSITRRSIQRTTAIIIDIFTIRCTAITIFTYTFTTCCFDFVSFWTAERLSFAPAREQCCRFR